MKRKNIIYIISIMLVLIIMVSACNKKEDVEKVDSVEDEINNDKIILDFNNMLEAEASPNMLVEYVNEHIPKLTEAEGSNMVSELEKALYRSIDDIKARISKLDEDKELVKIIGDELYFSQENISMIKNDELGEEVSKTLNSKYKLIKLEGEIYPLIDYEDFKKYNENISAELEKYIEIQSMDLQKPVIRDKTLNISYDELAERILKIEEYIKKYPEVERYEEMLKSYRNKLVIYLKGLDNNPIYEEETGRIKEEVLESYKKTSNTKETATGFIIRKQLRAIEENDYIINENVENNILSLVNEALSTLENSK